jgi:hypothetical protein
MLEEAKNQENPFRMSHTEVKKWARDHFYRETGKDPYERDEDESEPRPRSTPRRRPKERNARTLIDLLDKIGSLAMGEREPGA